MGKVVILDENTSNKIAAGEVIERPASVVKELVENSIDAGASSVIVEVKSGGITHIRVTDNGSGIDEDDAEIAFERHATSKIRNANDLDSITTLGFRGEALSSIAAVSSVELITRVQKNPYGISINIKGGSVKEVKQVGSPVGTTFIISDLFYNTPARYKFLKKDSTEFGYISEILNRIALANPGISFKLIGNNSTALHTPGNNDLLSVIFSIYGKEVSKNVLPVSFDDGRLKITGYAGRPEISRATRDYQSIFINGRYIKSRIISAAVDEAYKTILMKNKHPFIILNIELNPVLVDVNVHPTKMEVRFSEEQEIFRSVYHAVNNALLNTPLVRNIELKEKSSNIFKIKGNEIPKVNYTQQNINTDNNFAVKEVLKKDKPFEDAGENKVNTVENNYGKDFNSTDSNKDICVDKDFNESSGLKEDNQDIGNCFESSKCDTTKEALCKLEEKEEQEIAQKPEMQKSGVQKPEENTSKVQKLEVQIYEEQITEVQKPETLKMETQNPEVMTAETKIETGDSDELNTQNIFIDANIIGQVFLTYILLQREGELILIDQHAAHERIMFERFKRKYQNRESLAQMLIAPVVLDLQFNEIKLLEEKKEYLNNLGFIYENFGNNSIILRAVPNIDDSNSVKELFLGVLDCLLKSNNSEFNLVEEETLYTIACKAAVKANKKLDNSEIRVILKELAQMRNPYTCPHGRPVIVKLSKYELEKMFKRIV